MGYVYVTFYKSIVTQLSVNYFPKKYFLGRYIRNGNDARCYISLISILIAMKYIVNNNDKTV